MYANSGWHFVNAMEHCRGRSCLDVRLSPYTTPTLHRLVRQELLARSEQRGQIQHDFPNDSHLSELYRRLSNTGQGITNAVEARC